MNISIHLVENSLPLCNWKDLKCVHVLHWFKCKLVDSNTIQTQFTEKFMNIHDIAISNDDFVKHFKFNCENPNMKKSYRFTLLLNFKNGLKHHKGIWNVEKLVFGVLLCKRRLCVNTISFEHGLGSIWKFECFLRIIKFRLSSNLSQERDSV